MNDGGPEDDMHQRYAVFRELEDLLTAIDPNTLTADELEAIVSALPKAADRAGFIDPDLTNVVRLSEHRNPPPWEQVWAVFVDGVRRERTRVGQLLGIEPTETL